MFPVGKKDGIGSWTSGHMLHSGRKLVPILLMSSDLGETEAKGSTPINLAEEISRKLIIEAVAFGITEIIDQIYVENQEQTVQLEDF